MTYDLPLASTIILLFPMLYFLLASPSFLLVNLNDPIVAQLLRGLVNVPFALMSIACAIAALTFVVSDRPSFGMAIASVAVSAIGARRWFLRQMDAQIRARDAGDTDAVHRLRRLHWGAMLYNAIQVVAVIASIPFAFIAKN